MAAQRRPLYTATEYLKLEREADYKSEYLDGEIWAMAGASPAHVLITGNLVRDIGAQLKGGPCAAYPVDLRVRVNARTYCYPDVTVVCGRPEFDESDNLTNPTLIVEVLSPTTEAWDRGGKFARYRAMETLREYVLVSQDTPLIERFTRRDDGTWVYAAAEGLEAALSLPSIGGRLLLSEVYDRVEFPAASDTPDEERGNG